MLRNFQRLLGDDDYVRDAEGSIIKFYLRLLLVVLRVSNSQGTFAVLFGWDLLDFREVGDDANTHCIVGGCGEFQGLGLTARLPAFRSCFGLVKVLTHVFVEVT